MPCCECLTHREEPKITIEQGPIEGSVAKDIHGKTFFKFKGIPYAKPPLGDLRFKAPQPPEGWTDTFHATRHGDVCYSADPLRNKPPEGSENCLFLNVYTRKLHNAECRSPDPYPVLVWIHGGGFIWGSGNDDYYGPEFLLTEEVVLVTINYRLGLLGLLSFEDPSLGIPGNAGFKDQVMALRWVQTNIRQFGGNPDSVTIFGESAGAASVHLLMLSPLAKGLFHKAIAQSGCALNPWVESIRGTKLSESLGLDTDNEREIYDKLMTMSTHQIYEVQQTAYTTSPPNERRPLGVVIEPASPEAFLTEEPLDLVLTGRFTQVPFMIGYTITEGLFSQMADVAAVYDPCVPWYFGYKPGSPQELAAVEKIKRFYFGDGEITRSYNLITDCQVLHGIYVTVICQYHISQAPTYMYRISVESELNFLKKLQDIRIPGVSHVDDIGYLFKTFLTPQIKAGTLEDLSVKRFVRLWTNFAATGNPTPEDNESLLGCKWKPVTDPNIDCLDIGRQLVPLVNPDPERLRFWKDLFLESPAGGRIY